MSITQQAVGGKEPLGEGEHYNMEFERHSRSARETGKPDVSPAMQAALNAIYSSRDKADVIQINGSLEDIIKSTPEELG